MPDSKAGNMTGAAQGPPPLKSDGRGQIVAASLADVIQWFLSYDQRVAIIRHPNVEELFQWKQEQSRRENEDVYAFDHAEDRLAIGIMQAVAEHNDEPKLHAWIGQLLNTLDEATKTNQEIAESYKLATREGASMVKEAAKIPTARGRAAFLISCWLEALCTSEVRVIGWIYQELYGRTYAPHTFNDQPDAV